MKESEKNLDDKEKTLDTANHNKINNEPPYKTFDDIIKRLTLGDSVTSKPTIRRDYRNTVIEKYLKRDAYGNIFDSINTTKGEKETLRQGKSVGYSSSNKWRLYDTRVDANGMRNTKKISNAIGDRKSWKARKESERKQIYLNWNENLRSRIKSVEQTYNEEYEENEKDEDVAKIGRQRVPEMQADYDNTDYADEEYGTKTDHGKLVGPNEKLTLLVSTMPTVTTTTTTTPVPPSPPSPPSPLSTTRMTIPTTVQTITLPKPVISVRPPPVINEHKDLRSQESWSDSRSNGLHEKSAHNIHTWQSTNSRDGIKDFKGYAQQHNIENGKAAEIKEALQHARKVSREGSCQWPRARVIPVREVYPSPSTTYIPHCAILHRCSDDTGCCSSEALTCVPKLSHRVELYFYTTSIGGASVVKKLSFYNHTECECRERLEYGGIGGLIETTIDKTSGSNEQRFTRHHAPPPTPSSPVSSPPQNIRRAPPLKKPCRCPSEFTPRITPEGECHCNCFENHLDCIRTRRGKGYFSLRDRLCIQNEECATPMCEFGEYMRRQGKCPRKKDRFDAIANHPTNHINLHHRLRN
ncbi:uncharacterized protein [Venturia canescens]|uniref:uncharacterized protein n=1 Tax=Venturia canescens TaxID=32260 RepID=UPI001C9D1923|nr:uncharacterized protein LOC122408266 [Venturia canescens]